ncbi:MAG: extracellular solute-binding protein [Fimbriimonadaceae bacterium]
MLRFRSVAVLAALPLCALALAKEPVTLRFTVWDGDESLRVIKRILAQFERENPDIRVKLEPITDYVSYHQKMITMYAAGVAPDVCMMDMPNFQALAKRGALVPLNDLMAKTPGFDIKEYYEPIVRAHSYQGKLYVLPRDIAPMGLVYYNKRLFDEAGIPYPDGTWTWDFQPRPELREKCFTWVMQQLTKVDKNGKKIQWGFAPGWPELFATTLTYSYGGRYTDNPEAPTKVLINEPKTVRAYQFAADCMNKYGWIPNQNDLLGQLQSTTQMLFVNQKIAMFQNGIWEVPNMRKYLKPGEKGFFEWDITLFPAYKDGRRAAPTGGSGYAIFTSTKHLDEAWRLTRYMSGPVAMTYMAQAGIAQPAIRKLALTPDVWLPGPNTPKEQLYPYSRIWTDRAVPYVVFSENADYWPEVGGRMRAGMDLLWNGQKDAKETLDRGAREAQQRLDAILKEQRNPPYNWVAGGVVGLLIAAAIALWVFWPERKIRYTHREKLESRSAFLFASPWIVGMIVFTLGPMILSLLMGFADWDIIRQAKWRGLGNFHEAFFVDPVFWKSLRVTFVYTFVAVPLGLIGSLALALLMNQKVRGIPLFRTFYYIPSLASLVAASLIWRRVFQPEGGLLNTLLYSPVGEWLGIPKLLAEWAQVPAGQQINWLGTEQTALPALIIMSLWGIGGGMVILLAGLQGIPQFYYEAATLDGAGIWDRFKAVTLPLLSPSLFFSLVTGFIGSFQVFTQAFVMTGGGPNDATRFFMFHLYSQAFQNLRMGYASALAWILFFIILIFTLIQFKMSKWVYYEAEVKK